MIYWWIWVHPRVEFLKYQFAKSYFHCEYPNLVQKQISQTTVRYVLNVHISQKCRKPIGSNCLPSVRNVDLHFISHFLRRRWFIIFDLVFDSSLSPLSLREVDAVGAQRIDTYFTFWSDRNSIFLLWTDWPWSPSLKTSLYFVNETPLLNTRWPWKFLNWKPR